VIEIQKSDHQKEKPLHQQNAKNTQANTRKEKNRVLGSIIAQNRNPVPKTHTTTPAALPPKTNPGVPTPFIVETNRDRMSTKAPSPRN
jgi:hypothetical protein